MEENNDINNHSDNLIANETAVHSYFAELGSEEKHVSDSEIRVTPMHHLKEYYYHEKETEQISNADTAQVDLLMLNRQRVSSESELHWHRPLLLYLVTWICVCWAGGLIFALCVMTILTCHEMGHFLQTRRYRVRSSLPYFIPLPPIISLFGTMGAIIRMDGRIPNRRALFDIGISGPLAGLVPTLIFCVIGIQHAYVGAEQIGGGYQLGEPLFMTALTRFFFGTLPDDMTVVLSSVGLAGWFGLFLTSLNLFPIGQLDGGHVFYAILGKRAPDFSMLLFFLIVAYVIIAQQYFWIFMLALLWITNPKHPPTQDDLPPIGVFRTLLGWATLAFIIFGFTLKPISISPENENPQPVIVQMTRAETNL